MLATKLGVTALLNEVNRCRVIFKFASDQRLIPRPVHFGQSFDRPSKKVQRKIRNETIRLTFTRDELLKILDALAGKAINVEGQAGPITVKADSQLRAMTLLGLNAGLGVTDCANLAESHIDMLAGWLDYPRVKTETPRRVPLWPETIEALQSAIAERKWPRDPADNEIVFLTRTRRRWVRTKAGKVPEENLHLNALSQAFGKLLHTLNINGRRRLNFYTLRRQFEIVAGESRDQVAVDAIMGHVDDSMAAVYRQGEISDGRLQMVVEHVRNWLFGSDRIESRHFPKQLAADELSSVYRMETSPLPDKVWDLSNQTIRLFVAAAKVAAELQHFNECWDPQEEETAARVAVDRIGELAQSVESVRQQEALLRYFALAYKERLGSWYVRQENGKSIEMQRLWDDRPLETSPLEFRYLSYTDKALDLVSQLLGALCSAGSDVAAIAAAVPYLLDLTFDEKLVVEFVAELRQEAVQAAKLAAAEAGDNSIAASCERDPDQRRDAELQRDQDKSELCHNAVSVLICLHDRSLELLTLADVADKSNLSRDTAGKVLTELINKNLAHRPQGMRHGATTTARGHEIAEQLKSADPAQIRR